MTSVDGTGSGGKMNLTDVPCIRCGREVKPALPGSPNPDEAVMFTGRGAFGSEYDPMGDEYLLVLLCDQCLFSEGNKGHVIQCFPGHVRPPDRRVLWSPPDENRYDEDWNGHDQVYE